MACIAVVDDDPQFLALTEEILEPEGWDVLPISDGDQAFHALKREQPDLIILDVQMEHVDKGWQILTALTFDPDTRLIPVVICSANVDDVQDRRDWLRQHGVDVLPKPFDIDDLRVHVRTALECEEPDADDVA